MPTITVKNSGYAQSKLLEQAVAGSGATGPQILHIGEALCPPRDRLSLSGSFVPNVYEATHNRPLRSAVWKPFQVDGDWYDISLDSPMFDTTLIPNESWYCYFVDAWSVTPGSPMHRLTSELTSWVSSPREQVEPSLNPKLRKRLFQFGSDCVDQEPVSATTIAAVNALVAWLCGQSDTVSVTVSNDGVLSIATVFPNDVRLYVEIERDGSTGAAVTRERRYARDITSNTVADLNPEVILAAIRSV